MLTITRIRVACGAALLALVGVAALQPAPVAAQSADPLSRESILSDPAAPSAGNPQGDLTIVEWFDYQCPYCKKMHPDLLKAVQDDGHVRLVFKDWPVFGDVSVRAAQLVLAAGYHGKYNQAHDALMAIKSKLTDDLVVSALRQAGIDVERAQRDLAVHRKEITDLLARNHEQALALGFQGTPAFIIGHFRVPGVLDAATLKQAIKEARAALKADTATEKPTK